MDRIQWKFLTSAFFCNKYLKHFIECEIDDTPEARHKNSM